MHITAVARPASKAVATLIGADALVAEVLFENSGHKDVRPRPGRN